MCIFTAVGKDMGYITRTDDHAHTRAHVAVVTVRAQCHATDHVMTV